ncbi:MAG TPA: HesA/MoeB/ThiF family protein [Candidatus Diapherotrites archaeon]|nr:HesA/MoeB/ThiF family protein [Candidatus Diapherotrites archaeon]
MILEKEQIQRYLRHILMPEISGPGQKKLLESSILVYCDSISGSAVMLYYMAAMGIGKIACNSGNTDGFEFVFQKARGLNPDLDIQMADSSEDYDAMVVFCEKTIPTLKLGDTDIPVIFPAACGSCGYIRTARGKENINQVVDEVNSFFIENKDYEHLPLFKKACLGFAGTLAAIEAVKVLLGIGSISEQAFQFDLGTYDFVRGRINNKKAEYSTDPENAKQLGKAKVLIVGTGGLGSPVAYMLTVSGIGKLGLVDFDTVETSNLNRQILHSTETLGMAKVKSAEAFLKKLNPDMKIRIYEQKFSSENAEELIADYDIIISALDNLPNRYLLNDACYFLKKPLIEAGVLRFDGLATTIIPDKSPCYRCIFPETKDSNPVPACSETGVLGAVPGVMGMIQAIEALKHLTGAGGTLANKILLFDALHMDFTLVDIEKSSNCALCGTNPTITTLQNYEFVCRDK